VSAVSSESRDRRGAIYPHYVCRAVHVALDGNIFGAVCRARVIARIGPNESRRPTLTGEKETRGDRVCRQGSLRLEDEAPAVVIDLDLSPGSKANYRGRFEEAATPRDRVRFLRAACNLPERDRGPCRNPSRERPRSERDCRTCQTMRVTKTRGCAHFAFCILYFRLFRIYELIGIMSEISHAMTRRAIRHELFLHHDVRTSTE